jgi:hypothetical protein
MRIRDDVYPDGSKFLTLMTEDGQRLMSLGILFPGTHNLGIADQQTIIQVTNGKIHAQNAVLSQGEGTEFREGDEIILGTVDYAAYQIFHGSYRGTLDSMRAEQMDRIAADPHRRTLPFRSFDEHPFAATGQTDPNDSRGITSE